MKNRISIMKKEGQKKVDKKTRFFFFKGRANKRKEQGEHPFFELYFKRHFCTITDKVPKVQLCSLSLQLSKLKLAYRGYFHLISNEISQAKETLKEV